MTGSFNPAIFQPMWFAVQGLVSEKEAEDCRDATIHPELAFFRMSWLQLQVVPDRLVASTTKDSESGTLRDVVAGAFTALKHTPILKLGINLEQHFKMPNEDVWNAFGHRIAPKEVWNQVMKNPGLQAMTILDKESRSEDLPGLVRVNVEASARVKFGIYIRVNDHFDFEGMTPKASGTEHLLKILGTNYEKSLERSKNIAQTLIANV